MSWVSDKAALISILTASGYSRVPENLVGDEMDKSLEDFTYTLQLGEADTEEMTSGMVISSNLVIITFYYFNSSTDEYDLNYDNFISVCSSIKDLANFNGTNKINYERTSPETAEGTFEFYFGSYTC